MTLSAPEDREPIHHRRIDCRGYRRKDGLWDIEGHLTELGQTRFDAVLSDMAPATTGNRHVDEARSMGLCEAALDVADRTLVAGGNFVCKIFQGGDFKTFADAVKHRFERQTALRPQSTRKASREVFVIGLGKI